MTPTPIPLGSRSIEEIYEQAILLWIASKVKNPDINPAHGIYFALTDEVWPPDVTEVNNSIELCAVLSQAFGQPPLTEDQTKALNVKAMALFVEYTRGGGPIRLLSYVTWANGIGYVLAVVSIVMSGLSFWVIGLTVAVWACYGAARTAARMRREEHRPSWDVPVFAALHLAALLALYCVSISRLVSG